MEKIYLVFGEQAFLKVDTQRKKMNMSLFDIITYSFSFIELDIIKKKKSDIKKMLMELIQIDNEFNLSITSNTLTRRNVEYRFKTWLNCVKSLLKGDKNDNKI